MISSLPVTRRIHDSSLFPACRGWKSKISTHQRANVKPSVTNKPRYLWYWCVYKSLKSNAYVRIDVSSHNEICLVQLVAPRIVKVPWNCINPAEMAEVCRNIAVVPRVYVLCIVIFVDLPPVMMGLFHFLYDFALMNKN